MPPLLSICVPTFNRDLILKDCLENILLSKSQNIEIIISDNGSTDDTEQVVKSFNDIRLTYYKNQINLGYDLNIINLIKKARGKFIFFISDEDKINVSGINWIIDVISKNEDV